MGEAILIPDVKHLEEQLEQVSLESRILEITQDFINKQKFTGAVISVARGKAGDIPFITTVAAGTHDTPENNTEPKDVTPESFFDLASLTKPFTAVLAMVLSEKINEIDLNKPLSEYPVLKNLIENQNLQDLPLGQITLAQLLTHTSGLPPSLGREIVNSWSTEGVSQAQIKKQIVEIANSELLIKQNRATTQDIQSSTNALPHQEAKDTVVYSDLGYMLLGIILELLATEYVGEGNQKNLYQLMSQYVLTLLGIQDQIILGNTPHTKQNMALSNNAVRSGKERDKRPNVEPGQSHDNKAFWLLSMAGHAGLFGTSEGVMKFIRYFDQLISNPKLKLMLNSSVVWGSKKDSTLKDAENQPLLSHHIRTYGFLVAPGDSESAVAGIYEEVDYLIYHPGFTGTFMCRFVHPKTSEIFSVTILTNGTIYETPGIAPDNDTFRQEILKNVCALAA